MKGAACAAALLLCVARAQATQAQASRPCCGAGELLQEGGYCGNATRHVRVSGCSNGHFLIRDVVVKESGLTSADTPGFVFATKPSQYCLGRMKTSADSGANDTVQVAVVCFEKADNSEFELFGVLSLVSVVFLILTFAVFMFLPELRDLQGKCTMCVCISLALGFLNLGVMQLGYGFSHEICSLNGFLIYFWMMATFFWMNVVSINVYRSVTESSHQRHTETKQFVYYNLYAWGCTFIFLAVAIITNFVEGNHISPGFGANTCWFRGPKEIWTFFYGPVAILIASNITLFVLTSIRLWRSSKDYEVSKLKRLRYKFLLYLKLFIVMGLSWVFEIASFAHAQAHIIWRIADIFNCLQGVVYFLLLVVLRRRALRGLAARGLCGARGRRLLAERLAQADDEAESMVGSECDEAPYGVDLDAAPSADVPEYDDLSSPKSQH